MYFRLVNKLLLITFFIFVSIVGYSQSELSSIAFRIGNFNGLDYKKFFTKQKNIAIQLHLNYKEKSGGVGELTRFTPFFVYQHVLPFRKWISYTLSAFYGAGTHLGYSRRRDRITSEVVETGLEGGVDFMIGLELYSRKFPVNLAIDFSPYYNYMDIKDDNLWLNVGLSARYKLGGARR